jgi:hypothetical protein
MPLRACFLQDLLRPESENLAIRENEGGVFVGGVHQQEVQNITQCLHLLHLGDRNRTTAFTALNAHSSRSHAVVMLTVIKRRSVAGTGEAEIQRVKVGGGGGASGAVCRSHRTAATSSTYRPASLHPLPPRQPLPPPHTHTPHTPSRWASCSWWTLRAASG